MKSETKGWIIIISCLVIFLSLIIIGIADSIYYGIAKGKECPNDMLINTDNGHYCLTSNGYAQRVVFDCDGLLNYKECEMFEVS